MDIGTLLRLVESNLRDLEGSTVTAFGDSRIDASYAVQLNNIETVPFTEQNLLTVSATTKSDNELYDTSIEFQDVEYVEESDDGTGVYNFKAADGTEYYVTIGNGDVLVRCTCGDFRWRFAYYNSVDGSLLGDPPPPYVAKTDRAPANPSKAPGLCKHLIKLKDYLGEEMGYRL